MVQGKENIGGILPGPVLEVFGLCGRSCWRNVHVLTDLGEYREHETRDHCQQQYDAIGGIRNHVV